jgi:hypothetical protein
MTRNDRNCLLALLTAQRGDGTASEKDVAIAALGLLGKRHVIPPRRERLAGAGRFDPLQLRLFHLAQRGLVTIDKGNGRYSIDLDVDHVAKYGLPHAVGLGQTLRDALVNFCRAEAVSP